MKRCATLAVGVCLFIMGVGAAHAQQRGYVGIDVGVTSDTFDSLPTANGVGVGIDGQLAVLKSNPKKDTPNIVVGGEILLPGDTQNHAKEYAVFGGPEFPFHNFTFGLHAQIRKIYLPPSTVDNQNFVRDKMELLEIPILVRYVFGPAKHAFVQAEGAPEFSPRFRSNGSLVSLPNPDFDHAYFVRGTVGYNFGKWYAKATYENRYFKFVENAGNPSNLYNWKTNFLYGGVGLVF
jgi:hypothetical protein